MLLGGFSRRPGIVTGGTDCGIMKYVGQAISEIDKGKGGVQARRARCGSFDIIFDRSSRVSQCHAVHYHHLGF